MQRYEDLIVDLMLGDTPKEKYEIDFLKTQFEWINLNLEQGIGIPKSPIEAILNSFEKTEEHGQKIK